MGTDPLMERYTFDPHFEPEWCERCGQDGHNGLHCPEEDLDDEEITPMPHTTNKENHHDRQPTE